MISKGCLMLIMVFLDTLPVISLSDGYVEALNFLKNVIGFVNIFLPLKSLAPIIIMIIAIRKFNVIVGFVNLVLKILPFF